MGTSKGHMPPSNGDWSPLKVDITELAKNITVSGETKQKLVNKIIKDFVTAIGGTEGFSSSSKAYKIGDKTIFSSKAGRNTAVKVGSFVSSISGSGLKATLFNLKIDFTNLTIDELQEKIIEVFSQISNNDDVNAANKAMAEVIDNLFKGVDNIDELENKIISSLESESILCSFYERYIFKRFERNFAEYDIKKYGIDTAHKIMMDIENAISIKLKTFQCNHKLTDIDFKSNHGEAFVQRLLQELLEYLEVYDD